jgi:hypothetical protein
VTWVSEVQPDGAAHEERDHRGDAREDLELLLAPFPLFFAVRQ